MKIVETVTPHQKPMNSSSHTNEFEILLGMPHLAFSGLSEAWLLKELGHRHWFLLASMAKREHPDFQDTKGNVVYAAFRAVKIDSARFNLARENDVLRVSSTICRISRTQVKSEHRLLVRGTKIGCVSMVSVFVHRNGNHSNHSVVRVEIEGFPLLTLESKTHMEKHLASEVPMSETLRTGNVHNRVFKPCPSQDFNGAGFLYFANFSAFVDRAEWEIDPEFSRCAVTDQRSVNYQANLDPGEEICVEMTDLEKSDYTWRHLCRITRTNDNALMAEIVTKRRRVSPIQGMRHQSKKRGRPNA